MMCLAAWGPAFCLVWLLARTVALAEELGTLSVDPFAPDFGTHQQNVASGADWLESGAHQHGPPDIGRPRGRQLQSGATIALYTDPNYVDTAWELVNVEASLGWLGLTWTRYPNFTVWNGTEPYFIIPELERGLPILSSSEQSSLLTWMAAPSNRLILMGGHHNIPFMNNLFNWSLTYGTASSGEATLQSPYSTNCGAGCPWPNPLPLYSATFFVTGGLSSSASVVHRNANSQPVNFAYAYSGGWLTYLGFDWYQQKWHWDCLLGWFMNVNCWTVTTSTRTITTSTRTTSTRTTTSTLTTSTVSTLTTSSTTTSTLTATTATTWTSTTATQTTTTTTVTATTSTTQTSTSTTQTVTTTTSTVTTSSSTTATSTTTSSTSASSTTTSSTTATTSTTTVTAALAPDKQASLLEGAVDAAAQELLSDFLSSDANTSVTGIPGGTVLAVKLGGDGEANASVVIPAQEGVVVSVPGTLFAQVGSSNVSGDSLAVTITTFTDSAAETLGGEGSAPGLGNLAPEGQELASVTVGAALAVDLWWVRSSSSVSVEGLQDPIALSIPINRSGHAGKKLVCAYWSERKGGWSMDGIEAVPSADGPLVCLTKHLSLFGAIWLGFVQTILCAQIGLFSSESIGRLGQGVWYSFIGSITFWCVVLVLLGSFMVAAYLDKWRGQKYTWTTEFLVVPAPEPKVGREDSDDEVDEAALHTSRIISATKWILCGCISSLLICCQWMRRSAAVRDAVDDIISNWFDRFSDLRGLLEGCWEGLCENSLEMTSVGGATGRVFVLGNRIMSRMLLRTSRLLASVELGLGDDIVSFVLEDEDLYDYLVEGQAALPPEPDPEEAPCERKQEPPPDWRMCESPKDAWKFLHRAVVGSTVVHLKRTGCWHMPAVSWELFLAQNPFGSAFSINMFTSCKMRVLFFSMDIMGALALASFFSESSGSLKRRSSSSCSDDMDVQSLEDSIGFKIGRLFAIAMGSVLIAGVPVSLVETLHTKCFKRVEEANEGHKGQLRAWALQESFVWVLGVAYVTFCALFIAVFLANLEENDQLDWAIGGVFTVLNDTVALPLLLAVVVPTFGEMLLTFLCLIWRVDREALVRATQEKFHESTNAMLSLAQI